MVKRNGPRVDVLSRTPQPTNRGILDLVVLVVLYANKLRRRGWVLGDDAWRRLMIQYSLPLPSHPGPPGGGWAAKGERSKPAGDRGGSSVQ